MKRPADPADYFTVVDGRLRFYNGIELGDVYQEVDGYYVVTFDRSGCWGGSHLVLIGNLLEKMNQPWDEQVRQYFDDNPD